MICDKYCTEEKIPVRNVVWLYSAKSLDWMELSLHDSIRLVAVVRRQSQAHLCSKILWVMWYSMWVLPFSVSYILGVCHTAIVAAVRGFGAVTSINFATIRKCRGCWVLMSCANRSVICLCIVCRKSLQQCAVPQRVTSAMTERSVTAFTKVTQYVCSFVITGA
jgi:hypothetical protein